MVKKFAQIKSKLKELPDTPGVYLFMDKDKKIIYVGKAKRLKRRVVTYFHAGRAHDSRIQGLINEIRYLDFIKTNSEAEALIFEAGMIKDHRPKYNIDLKDDKSYPYLKLTLNEEYPRIFLTRRRLNDGAVYYGPYSNVILLKKALSFMKKVFPLRTCRTLKKKVCLEYHIGQCVGICEHKTDDESYRRVVEQLKAFLEGRKDDLIKDIKEEMRAYSKNREFEKAITAKKRIEALTAIQQYHDSLQSPMFGELDELQNLLSMKNVPSIIECFDISNIAGKQSVGSMVKFIDGKPFKKGYRKFRIRDVEGIDDYSMIREVVRRRYARLKEEKGTFPDLVLIDGGKGHLFSARAVLIELGIENIEIASIAKEYNHLYTSGKERPIRLSPGSRVLFLIQRVRDEAHRFAIKYHRSLRSKNSFSTGLKDIEGIGPSSEYKLLERFGSLENIKKASLEDILAAGLGRKQAKSVLGYFKNSM